MYIVTSILVRIFYKKFTDNGKIINECIEVFRTLVLIGDTDITERSVNLFCNNFLEH